MTGPDQTAKPAAWLIRAGRKGEDEDMVIEQGIACLGWHELPSLSEVSSRADIEEMIRRENPDSAANKRRIANWTTQLWSLRKQVRRGDLVVMPRKRTSQIALGVVTRDYWYRSDAEPSCRHAISVEWKRTDIPRTAVKQDLLYSLGSALSICQIKRNDGAWRLHQLLQTGQDPGARFNLNDEAVDSGIDTTDSSEVTDMADSLESDLDLERFGKDQIQALISERFTGHRLSHLVAGVLGAEGFFTEISPPGPDGGIDIFAGRGPLGLDSPRLIVQVKSSQSPADVKIVRELQGVLTTSGAEQALLVAWGGVNRAALKELRGQFFSIRLWDADNLLEAVLHNYNKLSEELRASLPLKRIWASQSVEE